jgi:phage FluMu protein Com
MTVADKILFTCSACEYKARIPAHYSGRSIHCPKCKTVQEVGGIVAADGSSASRESVPEANPQPSPGQGKIVFTCPDCSYKGRLSADYDGKTIRCPGCQKAQTVHGEPVVSPIVASMAADETVFRTGENEKVRFECGSCGYRAKIPGKYVGKPIHCPQCKEIQQVKPETDLEAATGRTVTIARVNQAQPREPRLAMTNVGVSFACAVCGYSSKISPSCAGDAVYCPSCRSPQKVEWGDPDELDAISDSPLSNEVLPVAAPDFKDDENDQVSSEPAPPVAPASATTFSREISGSSPALPMVADEPEALPDPDPVAPPVAVAAPITFAQSAENDADDGNAVDEEEAAPLPAPAPEAKPASEAKRVRRSVRGAAGDATNESANKSGSTSGAAAPAAKRAASVPAQPSENRAAPAASGGSKMPLVILAVLVLALGGVSGWLFTQVQGLQASVATISSDLTAQKSATSNERSAKETAQGERDQEKTRADSEKARADEAEATIASLNGKIDGLAADLKARDVSIAELTAQVGQLTKDLAAAVAAQAKPKEAPAPAEAP